MSPLARSLLALAALLAAAAVPSGEGPDPEKPWCTDYYIGDQDADVESFQFSYLIYADVPPEGLVLNYNIYKNCEVLVSLVSSCNNLEGNSTRPHVQSAGPGKYDVKITCPNGPCTNGVDAIAIQGCK